jgi:MarR family
MKYKSRNATLESMVEHSTPGWRFLTNHAQVLVCIAHDPGVRLREIGERVGITERAAHRIVVDLSAAGYITRQRNGRRNQYTINVHLPVHDPIAREPNVGQLLQVLSAPQGSERQVDHTGR